MIIGGGGVGVRYCEGDTLYTVPTLSAQAIPATILSTLGGLYESDGSLDFAWHISPSTANTAIGHGMHRKVKRQVAGGSTSARK